MNWTRLPSCCWCCSSTTKSTVKPRTVGLLIGVNKKKVRKNKARKYFAYIVIMNLMHLSMELFAPRSVNSSKLQRIFHFISTLNAASALLSIIYPTVHNGHRSNHNKLLTIVVCATNCEKFVRHQRRATKKKKWNKIKQKYNLRGRPGPTGPNKSRGCEIWQLQWRTGFAWIYVRDPQDTLRIL